MEILQFFDRPGHRYFTSVFQNESFILKLNHYNRRGTNQTSISLTITEISMDRERSPFSRLGQSLGRRASVINWTWRDGAFQAQQAASLRSLCFSLRSKLVPLAPFTRCWRDVQNFRHVYLSLAWVNGETAENNEHVPKNCIFRFVYGLATGSSFF